MLQALRYALVHTIEDSAVLLLFLFLTYLAMEYLEHRTGARAQRLVQKAGRMGPLIGAFLGIVPQCGFSAAASGFYAGRVITMGTLISIYLSTSDEMLAVMISAQAPAKTILGILAVKIMAGMTAGFAIDLIFRQPREEHSHIHELCEHEHCQCEKGIVRSAFRHTVQVGLFILIIGFALNLTLELSGEDFLAGFLLNRPIVGPVLAGLVGLIPNCAASVVLTELYLEGFIGVGSMLAGLLVGAGMGLLVLFRVNRNRAENLKITGLLYFIGVITGIVAELILG